MVAFDFGIKRSIVGCLAAAGCRVTVVPAGTSARDVLKLAPDGVFLSNGPGDPAAVTYAVKTVQKLLGKTPVFGICLGPPAPRPGARLQRPTSSSSAIAAPTTR